MLNKIMLIGNLGKDPELSYASNGKEVAWFTLAVSRRFTSPASGERREETAWFTVIARGEQAESCKEILRKGSKVYVEGRLRQRKYTDRQGMPRLAAEVLASLVLNLSPRGVSPSLEEGEYDILGDPEEIGDF